MIQYASALVAMALLLGCSAFFSTSEAALFYLRRSDRRGLAAGNRSQRIAAGLLGDPDRLLTAVLFWNLLVNLAYFAVAAVVGIQLESGGRTAAAGAFSIAALAVIIVCGEMLPKSLAVMKPRSVSALVGLPLAVAVRLLDPLRPVFRTANLLSRRLLWPNFEPEPYLHIRDLERAVRASVADAALVQQEQGVLERIVLLSEIRVDELMRPRTQFSSFRPPVALDDLRRRMPESGYLLVTEPDSDEVAAALCLDELWAVPAADLQRRAEPVFYVPWCATVADVLGAMLGRRQVAAVVNEHGETVGILTFDDILDTIFSGTPSRSERLLRRAPIRRIAAGVWHVTGMTSLRRLARYFHVERPASKSVTVAGIVQEVLERLPQPGDRCRWGPFWFRVIDAPLRGQLLVELTMPAAEEEPP